MLEMARCRPTNTKALITLAEVFQELGEKERSVRTQ
jgi:lipopolysaccharide biosynthesis regulator YciM